MCFAVIPIIGMVMDGFIPLMDVRVSVAMLMDMGVNKTAMPTVYDAVPPGSTGGFFDPPPGRQLCRNSQMVDSKRYEYDSRRSGSFLHFVCLLTPRIKYYK